MCAMGQNTPPKAQAAPLQAEFPHSLPGVGDAARSLVPQVASHMMAPQVFRHVFWPQPVPARFTARFPVEIALNPVQQRASAEDTATLNAAAALLQPHYSRLRVPLAIITGSADAVVNARDHSCRLHQQAPESTLTILPGQWHMIHYSAKGQIGRAVDSLMGLASTKPKRARRGSSSLTAPWPWVLP